MDMWYEEVEREGMTLELSSWHLLLRKAEIERDPDAALFTLDNMVKQGVALDVPAYRFLLNTLADAGLGLEVDTWVNHLLDEQISVIKADTRDLCSLFARLIARRMTDETVEMHCSRAEGYLDALRELEVRPSSSVWGALMRVRVANAVRCGSAGEVLEVSLEEAVGHERAILKDGILALVSAGFPMVAWKWMEKNGIEPVANIYKSDPILLSALLRSAPTAKHVFQLWKCRHEEDSYQEFLVAYLRVKVPWKVALEQMDLLHSLEAIVFTMNTLLRQRESRLVLEIWDYVVAQDSYESLLSLQIDVYIVAIAACATKLPRGNHTLDPRFTTILESLLESGLPPDDGILISILQTQGKCGDITSVLAFLRAISERLLGPFEMNAALLEGIVDSLAVDAHGAQYVPEILEAAKKEWGVDLSVSLYNQWIRALHFHNPDSALALHIYEEMKEEGLMPTASTYNNLFRVLDEDPNLETNDLQLHYLLHDWKRVSNMQGKNALTNNLLLKALRNRPTYRSQTIFWRIFQFMSTSGDVAQWPTSDTYHIIVRHLVRKGDLNKAVLFIENSARRIAEKQKRGLRPELFWSHTIEYLLGILLGEDETKLASRLREWAQTHNYFMGPTDLRTIDVDDD